MQPRPRVLRSLYTTRTHLRFQPLVTVPAPVTTLLTLAGEPV